MDTIEPGASARSTRSITLRDIEHFTETIIRMAESSNLLDAVVGWCAGHPGSVEVILAPPYPFLASAVERVCKAAGQDGKDAVVIAALPGHAPAEAERGLPLPHGAQAGVELFPQLAGKALIRRQLRVNIAG